MKTAVLAGVLYLGMASSSFDSPDEYAGGVTLDLSAGSTTIGVFWQAPVVSEQWKVCWKKAWSLFAKQCQNSATVFTSPTSSGSTTIVGLTKKTNYRVCVSAGGWSKSKNVKTKK